MSRGISTVLLLGGSELLWAYLGHLRERHAVKPIVLSSKRHLDALLDETRTLREALAGTDVPCLELDSINAATLDGLGVDLSTAIAVSFHAAWIIRQDVIDRLGGRIYNAHGTRLPQDRGGASVSWQIMRGHRYGFAVLHLIDAGVDTGDLVEFHEFLYDDCRTPLDHQRRYAVEVQKLLERVTPRLLEGAIPPRHPQAPYLASYWPRLNTELQGWIDWSWSGTDIHRFICAFDEPYAGAHSLVNDRIVYLKDCSFDTNDGLFHPFQAGLIYRLSADYAAVATTSGSLLVRRVFHDRGEPMPLGTLRVGDRFFTPVEKLEAARRTRVQYTATGLRPPTG